MGTSVHAHLAYGIDLGNADNGWKLKAGSEPMWWYDENDEQPGPDHESGPDFEAAHRHLLTAVGFTEDDYNVPGYFDRLREAEQQVGVTFDSYGHVDYPGWMIRTTVYTVHVSETLAVPELAAVPWMDQRIDWACDLLGIHPTTRPAWLLCSDWG